MTNGIEQRIQAFERYEACVAPDAPARPCCKARGALKAGPEDRRGNAVAYRCRTCGTKHVRLFVDLSVL